MFCFHPKAFLLWSLAMIGIGFAVGVVCMVAQFPV